MTENMYFLFLVLVFEVYWSWNISWGDPNALWLKQQPQALSLQKLFKVIGSQ